MASEEEKPKAQTGWQGEVEVEVYHSIDQVTGALLLHFLTSEELNVNLPRDHCPASHSFVLPDSPARRAPQSPLRSAARSHPRRRLARNAALAAVMSSSLTPTSSATIQR